MTTLSSHTAITCPAYIVRVSSAKMPSSCWGRYEHVAVLEVDPGVTHVPAIDDRCRGVRRIVTYEGRLHAGHGGERTAATRAYRRALATAARLSAEARREYCDRVDAEVAAALASRTDEI